MVIIYKFREKVCGFCEEKNACRERGEGVIINAGENSPAIRQTKGQISSRRAGRKEKMDEDVLFGKYRFLKLLANGNGGEVFLAEHRILGERRVIKRLLKNRPFYEERKKEAHTLKTLHHRAIPRIYDIEEDETACYIIEEDMGGETLHDFLLRQKCLPTSFISHYSIQLCEIIEYLHQNGILYLDVKPENIMIREDKLSLIDFGGAIRKRGESGVVFGTLGYAAPEQYDGMAEERSDVYGIGCVLGVMLGTERKGRKELCKIYERCVRNVPERRYPNVSALKEELEKLSFRGRKARIRRQGKVPAFIGVIGVHDGAESGALCTLLAAHFKEREKGRIVCIDLSGQHIFERLYECMFGNKKPIPESFVLQGICYVTEGNASVIASYAAQEYSTIILHIGTLVERYRTEFFRCDSRFALGNLYPWRLHDWKELSVRLSGMKAQPGVVAVLTGGEKELLPIRCEKVIELPLLGDVLLADRKVERRIGSAF